jgi:hypothetical protein
VEDDDDDDDVPFLKMAPLLLVDRRSGTDKHDSFILRAYGFTYQVLL